MMMAIIDSLDVVLAIVSEFVQAYLMMLTKGYISYVVSLSLRNI